jgi:hypothetical protein
MRVWCAWLWLERQTGPIIAHFLAKTITMVFAMIGAVVGLHKALLLFFGANPDFVHEVEQDIQGNVIVLLALMVSVALWRNWPRPFARVNIPSRRLTIDVIVANLFKIKGAPDLVIGGNSQLITRTTTGENSSLVSLKGVQGQFQQLYYSTPKMEQELKNKLRNSLGRETNTDYAMGKVAIIDKFDEDNPQRKAYYLVMAKPNNKGGFDTSLPEVKVALARLWSELTNGEDRSRTVAMHLLGTGVLGLAVSRQLMVMEMVDSLIEAFYVPDQGHLMPLRKLIVAIRPEDYWGDDEVISFYELQQHLNALKRLLVTK